MLARVDWRNRTRALAGDPHRVRRDGRAGSDRGGRLAAVSVRRKCLPGRAGRNRTDAAHDRRTGGRSCLHVVVCDPQRFAAGGREGIIGVCPRRRRPSRQRTAATQWRRAGCPDLPGRHPDLDARAARRADAAAVRGSTGLASDARASSIPVSRCGGRSGARGGSSRRCRRRMDRPPAAAQRPLLAGAVRSWAMPARRQHGVRMRARSGARSGERPLSARDLTRRPVDRSGPIAAAQDAGTGPIVLYDTATGQFSRELTTGAGDGFPAFSPDSRRVAFNRGNDIYVTAVDGRPGSERRIVSGGLQPQWVSAGAACHAQRLVRPSVRGRNVTVRACAPAAGRLTVMLTRHGRPVARRTVRVRQGGIVTIHFARPSRDGPLSATVTFRAA